MFSFVPGKGLGTYFLVSQHFENFFFSPRDLRSQIACRCRGNLWFLHHRLSQQSMLLGGERHCGSKVSCPRTQRNNPKQGSNRNPTQCPCLQENETDFEPCFQSSTQSVFYVISKIAHKCLFLFVCFLSFEPNLVRGSHRPDLGGQGQGENIYFCTVFLWSQRKTALSEIKFEDHFALILGVSQLLFHANTVVFFFWYFFLAKAK